MVMKILLFGKNGQVGWELQRSLAVLGEVTAVDWDGTEHCGDFANTEGVLATVRALQPENLDLERFVEGWYDADTQAGLRALLARLGK